MYWGGLQSQRRVFWVRETSERSTKVEHGVFDGEAHDCINIWIDRDWELPYNKMQNIVYF